MNEKAQMFMMVALPILYALVVAAREYFTAKWEADAFKKDMESFNRELESRTHDSYH